MAKSEKKVLSISIEFTDMNDLNLALYKIKDSIQNGKKYEREVYLQSIVEWSCWRVKDMNYREEVIDGKLCQIYQSSMNFK